jgi:glycosyltransferase involved in cell wall biosynthesis
MAEVVKEGQDGLLAKPFSDESLASQIQQLIDSPETCVKLGAAGHQRILNEFNQAAWLKRINKVFHEVVLTS